MGEKGNVAGVADGVDIGERVTDAARGMGDATIGVVTGATTGVATNRLEKKLDGEPDDGAPTTGK